MFLFLPILFCVFCALILYRYLNGWRSAILCAAIVSGTALTGITEGLSLIRVLSFYPVVICWSLLTISSGLWAVRGWPKTARLDVSYCKNWFLSEKIFLGIILFIGAASAVTAMVGVPNTWDAMTYHLPRVEHWIQDKTVAFYPTNDIRQLYITPWAEFAIAHVRILGGGESSANGVQWLAMVGSLIGVSLLARQLGAVRLGQLMAAVLAATLPMGILQSVSTQTDYVGAFWLIAFVVFLIETQRSPRFIYTMAAGLSLGLALLTKGNSYIFAAPFLIWFMGTTLKRDWRRSLAGVLLIVACAVFVNVGQYARNVQTFGTPTWTSVPLTNASLSPKVLWVNILRNTGVHLAMPWMDVNARTVETLTRAARFLGADIDDPRATFGGSFAIRSLNFDEDYTGNFLHLLLFGGVFLLFWFSRALRQKAGFYILTVALASLLFCWVVRYQPWNSRFHLPVFILFCPVAGVLLEHFLNKKSVVVGILLFLTAIPWMFYNQQHPWMGDGGIWRQPKVTQYFYKRPYLILPYFYGTKYLKSIACREVGLLTGGEWEYPWWQFLRGRGLRIEHVQVANQSGSLKYPLGDFQPCALVVSSTELKPYLLVGRGVYAPAWQAPAGDDKITIFVRKF